MTSGLYVGIGPPNVSTYGVVAVGVLVLVGGVVTVVNLVNVTAVHWEVQGPGGSKLLPATITSSTSTTLETMRTHATTDFTVEGHYDMRVRLTLPGGHIYTDWSVLRVRRLPTTWLSSLVHPHATQPATAQLLSSTRAR